MRTLLRPLLREDGLTKGRVLRRYQRFLCDVTLDDGSTVVAHCTNTGSMATCWEPGDPVLLRHTDNPRRKTRYTWVACCRAGVWVGVDTLLPNRVVAQAAREDLLPGLPGLQQVRTEVCYGNERSRIDVLAEDGDGRQVYVEVKNTTLRVDSPAGPLACFPDAVTARGTKHLRELQVMVRQGHRGAVVFFVHRDDVVGFDAARTIDPEYASALDRAARHGVEVVPVQAKLEVAKEAAADQWSATWRLPGLLAWEEQQE